MLEACGLSVLVAAVGGASVAGRNRKNRRLMDMGDPSPLSKNPMTKRELKKPEDILGAVQRKDPFVREIHLQADDDSFPETLEAVAHDPYIQSVSISGRAGREISPSRAASICALVRDNKTLEELRLYYASSDHSISTLQTIETSNVKLRSLLFSPNRELTKDEARQLCRVLQCHPTLRSLTVSCKSSTLSLLKLQTSSLKSLELHVVDMTMLRNFKPPRALEDLKMLLRGRSFPERRNADSFHSFFERFREMQSIRSLKLTMFGFGYDHDVCRPIREALVRHGNIRSFTLLWSSDCFHPGLESLAPFVDTLHIARLSRISEDPMVANILAKCEQLRSIQLIDVQMTDEAFARICVSLYHNTALECIHLQHVSYTDAMSESLIDLVKINKRITSVEGLKGMPRTLQEELCYHVKLNQVRLEGLLKDELPLPLWPKLISDLGMGGWHNVVYRLLQEKHGVLIQPGPQGESKPKKKRPRKRGKPRMRTN